MPKQSRRARQREDENKFEHERSLAAIEGKTENQKIALQGLYDPSVKVVILSGKAGSGKSFLSGSVAGDLFKQKKITRIVVARPYIQTGKTSGFKPGSSLEKLFPYIRNILDNVKNRIGGGSFDNHLKDGQRGEIEVQEIESIRGRSFDEKSFLIIDEAQQTTPEEMESIVTRVGEDCKLVLCGDPEQKDISSASGLEWFIDFSERHNLGGVVHVQFTTEDCQRGGLVKNILRGVESDRSRGIYIKDFK